MELFFFIKNQKKPSATDSSCFQICLTLATQLFFEVAARKFHKLRENLWDRASQGTPLMWRTTKNPGQISELSSNSLVVKQLS